MRIPPDGVGADAAPVSDIVWEEERFRITAEELHGVKIVVVKLVLRERMSLKLHDVAVHGDQRHRFGMRNARRRQRKVILSRAELFDVE